MDHDSLYETDICTWADQQAAALRSLASRSDLPNQLDLMNIVEEIEDVGSSHFNAVNSFIRLILSHMILIIFDQDADSVPHSKAEVATFHAELLQRYQPSMRQRVDVDLLWRRALREAHAKLAAYRRDESLVILERVRMALGLSCPIGVDEVCDENFEVNDAIDRLRNRLSMEPSG